MAEQADARVSDSDEATTSSTFPQRLRSALLSRGWTRSSEPRVKSGQPLLPGLVCLGPGDRAAGAELLAAAEALRAGQLTLLGRSVPCEGEIDWAGRDATPTWRMALHSLEHVVPVAYAAVLAESPEERAAWWNLAAKHLEDWLTRGRRGHGAAARLEAQTRRLTNLIQVATIFAPELEHDPDLRRPLLESMYADGASLSVTLPRHPADIWLVVGSRALVMAGRFFDGEEPRGWVEAGTGILWRQLRELVHDDGGLRDRSPARQAVVLTEYLELLACLWANVEEIPAWERKRVRTMTFCLARLLHPDGELALGDGTPSVIPHPGHELMAVAAVVLDEPAFATGADLPGVWPVAILGKRSRRVYQALARQPQGGATPRALRRTGFYVLPGDPGDVMILDAGGSAVGRGGGFAFECSVGGQLLVVGPGAGADDGHPLASWARGPQSRNVLLDRRSLASSTSRTTAEPDIHWTMRDGLLCFAGVDQRGADQRHRRSVFCMPGRFWIVCDEVLGTGQWEGDSLLHLHPDVRLRATCVGKLGLVAERSERASVGIVFGSDEVSIQNGVEGTRPQGWFARRPSEFEPAPAVAIPVAGTLPLVTGYALLPRQAAPGSLVLESDGFQLRATLQLGDEAFVITVVDQDVEFVRRTGAPSLERPADDEGGDPPLVVAE